MQLTVTSPDSISLRPFLQSALKREVGRVEVALKQAHHRVQQYEKRFGLPSEQFLERYRNNEIDETLETIEWVGEYRMLVRLEEKLRAAREIEIGD